MPRIRGSERIRIRQRKPAPKGNTLPQHASCCRSEDESTTMYRSFITRYKFVIALLMIGTVVYMLSLLVRHDSSFRRQTHAQSMHHLPIHRAPHPLRMKTLPDYGGIHYNKADVRKISRNDSFVYEAYRIKESQQDGDIWYPVEEEESHHCQAPAWKTSIHPTCNIIHEGNLVAGQDSYQQGHGYSRQAWIVNSTLEQAPTVLKLLKLVHFKKRNLHTFSQQVNREAVIMGQLHAAPEIMDILQYCGTSLIVPYMKSMEEDLIIPPTTDNDGESDAVSTKTTATLYPDAKLHLAYQMANSLAQLHGYQGGVIIHGDVQLGQWLLQDNDKLVLGDFNLAKVLSYNTHSHHYCKTKQGRGFGNNRAPEEVNGTWLDQQIDVFSLCTLYYSILTGREMSETDDVNELARMAMDSFGSRAESALARLLPRCWKADPSSRIDIFHIVQYLEAAIKHEQYHHHNN